MECRRYAEEIAQYTEKDFMTIFETDRPRLFIEFCNCLLAANHGPMLNNFDLRHFSMPMEFNPEIQFQLIYAVRTFQSVTKQLQVKTWTSLTDFIHSEDGRKAYSKISGKSVEELSSSEHHHHTVSFLSHPN